MAVFLAQLLDHFERRSRSVGECCLALVGGAPLVAHEQHGLCQIQRPKARVGRDSDEAIGVLKLCVAQTCRSQAGLGLCV